MVDSDKTILNLGCGRRHMTDAVNLDITPDTDPDVVHNLNLTPWPFKDEQFQRVVMLDVMEHLDDVGQDDGRDSTVSAKTRQFLRSRFHNFSCGNAFTDPTHRHYFGRFSFNYFTGEHQFSFYTQKRFVRRSVQIVFKPTLINKLILRLANRYPEEYERRWAWIFPAWFLHFELEVQKS